MRAIVEVCEGGSPTRNTELSCYQLRLEDSNSPVATQLLILPLDAFWRGTPSPWCCAVGAPGLFKASGCQNPAE